MKILFFIPNINSKGGVERATINLLNALSEHSKIEVNLLLFKDIQTDSVQLNHNINISVLHITNYKKQYFSIITGIKEALKKDIDILITIETMSLIFSFIPCLLSNKNIKHVVWEHFNFRNNNGKNTRKWLRFLAAKKTDLIILLSQRDKDEWLKNIKVKAAITYIYNISPYQKKQISYNLESKTIISIGRYTRVKGFERLIKTWEIFQKKYKYKYSDWNLNIIGYGQEEENLNFLIKKNNIKNIYLMSTDDIEATYKNASFYCLTSYFEGLPMVLIEAQSFGLPSIAFDIFTGPSEILSETSGVIINDGDLESFADEIYNLISNPELRKNMSFFAWEESKRFAKEAIAKKWIYELEKIIN